MLGRLICPSWGEGKPLRWRASLVHSHSPVLLLLFECNFLVLYRFFSSPPPAVDCVWINSGEFRVFGPFCCLFSPATATSHPTARVGIKKKCNRGPEEKSQRIQHNNAERGRNTLFYGTRNNKFSTVGNFHEFSTHIHTHCSSGGGSLAGGK